LAVKLVFKLVPFAIGVALSIGVAALWMATYPDSTDPKNLYYVLWKHGLDENMNLDNALGAMTHDVGSEKLVSGLSRGQLEARFGYVRTLERTTPYLRDCYAQHRTTGGLGLHDKDVLFLRDSWYMVTLDDSGKAVDLVLCKGF
jgi:hypothetical protein